MRSYDSLSGDAEFARLRKRGRRIDGAHVAIVGAVAPRGLTRPRIAIVPAKGLSGAVERNRVRRRTRAALEAVGLPGNGIDMIVIARHSARDVAYTVLCEDMRSTLQRVAVAVVERR
ncbi:MAG: ribonuclease P protein component [Vulcanimicrobiaceae bacterium]